MGKTLNMIGALMVALQPGGAFACGVAEEFRPTDLATAPVVVTATVTGWTQDPQTYVGTLQVEVTGLLKGRAPTKLSLVWLPDLSEWPPEVWDRETALILAAIPPQDDLGWRLAVETCGPAWILPDTPENRAIVAAAIGAAG